MKPSSGWSLQYLIKPFTKWLCGWLGSIPGLGGARLCQCQATLCSPEGAADLEMLLVI